MMLVVICVYQERSIKMKRWLSTLTAACLLLYPFAAFSADYGSQSSQTQQGPPVAQPLVREGDFAIKLAAELDLGNPADEAIAEDMLVKVGVAPSNGWLSDYPVTPEIIGQLQTSIAKAASDGKLPMNSDEATRGLYSLTQHMNLPTPAGPGNAAPEGEQPPAVQSNPTVINNYYDEQGPPIVTYYPPPYYDAYLYDWVPYPAVWFGFWFPGFYICHSFTTVVVTRVGDFDHQGRRGIVSNRVIDPVTRRVALVDPVSRTSAGSVRPMTTLRTGNGMAFRNIGDMRRGYAVAGVRRQPEASGASRIEGFRTSEARRSAGVIYSRSIDKRYMNRGGASSMFRGKDISSTSPGSSGRSVRISPRSEYRPFGGQNIPSGSTEWRSLAPVPRQDRMFSAPLRGGELQRPVVPSGPPRSFNAPVIRRGGGAGRAFCRGRC
jgi:hypothetical protein